MKILTIIVSYNFMPWLHRCLDSMLYSDYPSDIMVLDNGSSDETVAHIRKEYPQVRLIENGRNLGFGAANNIGIQLAIKEGYDAVLLLNEDAWLYHNTLGVLAKAAAEHPEYGIISPVHLTGKGDKPEHGFSQYTGLTQIDDKIKNKKNKQPARNVSSEPVAVPFINAAIWLIRTEVLKKVGLFAPIFYHYGEDKDMANRMAYYHYKIGYVPTVFACHDREFRQPTRERFFHTEKVYHLSEYTNPNHNFGTAFAHGILAVGKKVLSAFLKGKWKDAGAYIKIGNTLLLQTKAVIHARNISKHVDLKNYKV